MLQSTMEMSRVQRPLTSSTLWAVFAEVSRNTRPCSLANCSPSSVVTARRCCSKHSMIGILSKDLLQETETALAAISSHAVQPMPGNACTDVLSALLPPQQ